MVNSGLSACRQGTGNLTISVVSPNFNQAEFLAECLSSVRDQTYKPIEHLVFDPGSTDGSRDVAARFPNVTLIAEPDEGQSEAVNKGFSRARGEIIAWLNSDDCLAHPRVFECVVQRFLQDDEPGIVYGRGIFTNESGKKLRDVYINKNPASLNWRLQQEDGILQPALFMRRSVIDRVGPLRNDLHYCMDYEYWIRCVKAEVKFVYLDVDLAIARYHDNNKTYGMRGKSYYEICDMLKEHFGYVSHVWLKRYAEFLSDGHDGVLVDAENAGIKDPDKFNKIYRGLLLAYNGSYDSRRLLSERAPKKSFGDTLREMKRLEVEGPVPCHEIPTGQEQKSSCVTYTVGARRWAFDAKWKTAQIVKSHKFFRNRVAKRHRDTCIIVGNGPTLNQTDFSLLKNQDVIVSNNVFLSDELIKYATYYTVVNYLVAEQSSQHINRLEEVHKVLPYWLAYCLNPGPNVYFVDAVGYAEFSTNMFENMSWRHTVTFFNLHLAYGLGYRKVVMIGFDHNYKQPKGVFEQEVIQNYAEDDNHFHSGYFRGKKWQAADTSNMEKMYLLARTAYEKDERDIVNCTIGGHLEVFRRGDLNVELGLENSRMSYA
ncbi:MAG: glycosyltransferase [Nitrospirales bacterium]|nr:glycosyltransferase [Nitrospirales bacterium]NKB82254.1 glycosyltransferase [Nitrospirales bacterium]